MRGRNSLAESQLYIAAYMRLDICAPGYHCNCHPTFVLMHDLCALEICVAALLVVFVGLW